jgi:acyl-CoA synthetase (AMP-forming)/AMP-acid ligase II
MGNAFERRAPRNAAPDTSKDTIVSRFERQVATVPNIPAVVTENGSVTYRELGAVTDNVAAHLGALPSRSELPIGLLMAEGPKLIAGMFAISYNAASASRTALHTPDVRAELLQLRSGDRVANLRSSGVVAGIHNSLLPLLNGACLLPFDLHKRGLHGLTPWLNEQKITGITFSGSLLRTWLSSLDEEVRFPSLRFVIASSEPLYGADVVALARHLEGDWRIMHTQVSTETGIIAAQMFDPSSHPEPGIVPVGSIVRDTVIRLERDDGTLAGPGESGEIIVKSPFLAQGYWNDPDATARAFRHDVDGRTRIYRSGDLGRWRSDGSLQHLGRKNRKIKLRGYSVEPYEVECALSTLPEVREAIVTVTENGPDDVRLIAYVVSNGDTSAEIGRAFRAAVAKSLPAHMVPAHVIVLKSLPLTPRGKVDRAALPPPPSLELVRSRAPSGTYERALTSIWQNALKIPKIGVNDDFYEMGGTSLQAFLIFAGIARTFARDLPPSTMLETPTIEKQAALLRNGASPRNASKLIAFRESGSEPPLFLVHAAFGDIAYAGELARHLKSDRPVFGLRPPKLDGTEPISRNMEAIAADYITEIRQVQRKGPYFLAGIPSAGGSPLRWPSNSCARAKPSIFSD